ncbi:carotenoid oxygenase family protein [Nocardia beijingensis]|uniref:carotenoid oxygenase family protein n=1 Tax=Nocardia beijingensis TaxID=95162 RepID=UPI000A3EAFF3|nr:carotenoid oxygenase family protein [Nocardia beijingensis]
MTTTQQSSHPLSSFPDTPGFTNLNRPMRTELDVFELEWKGDLPEGISGGFYRCGPDPQFPPKAGDDIYVNGDGVVSMFRIADGHVDLKIRYVRTDKFQAERFARRALFGAYRNPYTDDPSVAGVDRTTANTSILRHAGRTFALKEDGLPHEIDPTTLETIGKFDFEGRLRSKTFTAHPKTDPVTGELVFFGYSAKGDELSTDIALCTASADGELTSEQWFLPPYGSMVHDWLVSAEHVIFPVMPLTTDPERLQAGGPRWLWDGARRTALGVLRRGAPAEEIRWFDGPPRWSFHTMNAVTRDNVVTLDLCVSHRAPFPDTEGEMFEPKDVKQYLTRWTCDLDGDNPQFTEERLWDDCSVDFPVIDSRYLGREYRHGFMAAQDPSKPLHPQLLGGLYFNSLAHFDHATGEAEVWYAGEDASVQEPAFVPRSPDAPEGDGYLLSVVDRVPFDHAELVILDTARFSAGPVATVTIPLFLRPTFHGIWVAD